MDDIRRDLLAGKPVKACRACYDAERQSGTSLRQHFNRLWLDKMPGLLDIIRHSGEKAAFNKPRSIDVRFGNLCNLQCQICNPHNSTQIERDVVLSRWNGAALHRFSETRFGEADWYEAPQFEAELGAFTADLRYTTLGGGEPSISKPAARWLQRLIDGGQARDIEIHISTNTTNVNLSFFDLAAKFGRARFYLSIDGFGPLNDYLRYPSKWRIVERNVEHLMGLARQADIGIAITPVVNAYNALSIVHLFEWADAKGFDIYAYPVRGVPQIDCSVIPEQARNVSTRRMRDFVRSAANPKSTYETIDALCKYLDAPVDGVAAAAGQEAFRAFTRELDNDRGMRFEDYAPEMASILDYSSRSNSFGDLAKP